MGRSVLLEFLILESKGYLNISSRRVIEICCGWGEDTCDEELEYRKYLEAYHHFLECHSRYVVDNTHDFGIVQMFEDVDDLICDGHVFRVAVIKMLRMKMSLMKIPLAEPPHEFLHEDIVECLKDNERYLDIYMFDGKISVDGFYPEIV